MTEQNWNYSPPADGTATTAAPADSRPYPTLPAAADISGEAGHTAAAGCTTAQHGTAAAYRRGCRCDLARHAMARYQNERLLDAMHGRSRTLSNVGTIRRLHALRALGWPSRELARRIGVDERNIARWPHRTTISRAHHDAVCRVYVELSTTRGPDERARRHAVRQGWLPPICLDDDLLDYEDYNPHVDDLSNQVGDDIDTVAVERAAAGDRSVRLNRAEKRAALLHMVNRGISADAAAKMLGLNGTYKRKYALELGLSVGTTSNDAAIIDDFKETG